MRRSEMAKQAQRETVWKFWREQKAAQGGGAWRVEWAKGAAGRGGGRERARRKRRARVGERVRVAKRAIVFFFFFFLSFPFWRGGSGGVVEDDGGGRGKAVGGIYNQAAGG